MTNYGPIPPGKKRLLIEVDQEVQVTRAMLGEPGYEILKCERGPARETPQEKKARLLRDAADLIRRGTQINSPIGSMDLRQGLIYLAEALEIKE